MNKKILFVEDEEAVRVVMGIYFAKHDIECIMAESGEEAIAFLRQHHKEINLILLDLMMPGMSGYDVLSYVGADKEISIPIVVQTGVGDDYDLQRARSLGAKEILLKPYPESQLLKVIKKYSKVGG